MRAPMLSPPRGSVSDLGGSKSEMGHRDFCGFSPIPIRVTGKKKKKQQRLLCQRKGQNYRESQQRERERGCYHSNGLEREARKAPIKAWAQVYLGFWVDLGPSMLVTGLEFITEFGIGFYCPILGPFFVVCSVGWQFFFYFLFF